jgi:CBS domain containing-hemolysin-like protein
MNLEWVSFLAIAVLLALSSFFSSSETALLALDEMKIKKLENKKDRKHIKEMIKRSSLLLIAILLGNTTVNTALISLLEKKLNIENVIYSTMVVTIIMLFFGEIFPKTIAIIRLEKIALFNSRLLYPFFILFKPLLSIVDWFTTKFLSLVKRLHRKESAELNKNEISTLLSIVSREEIFEREEKKLIKSVLHFAGREVWNIITPRTKVISVEKEAPIKEVIKLIKKTKVSKIPVYQNTDDNMVGVIYLRDVFQYVYNPEKGLNKKAHEIMEPMYFVPETKKLSEMLEDFRKKRIRIAAVIDEYGSSIGIVTVDDVLGEIVGELMDENFTLERKINRMGKDRFLVHGDISLVDFNTYFESALSSKEYETLAGYMIEKAGDIPDTGFSIDIENYKIIVKDRSEKKVECFVVEKES